MVKFFNLWVIITLISYYFGPIDWPGASSFVAFFYVLFCLAAFNLGNLIFSKIDPGPPIELVPVNFLRGNYIPFAVLILYIFLDYYYFYLLTGRIIFNENIFNSSSRIYNSYVISIIENNAPRSNLLFSILLSRSVLYLCVLCIFFQNFRNRVLFFGCLLALSSGTFFRGTNKEVLDLLIIIMVGYYYFGDHKKVFLIASGGALFFIFVFYFLISQRYGGNLITCSRLANSCIDTSSFFYSISPNFAKIYFILTSYITQGYEGLQRSFDISYDFTFGIGHLPVLYNFLCGPEVCGPSFQAKLRLVGWDTRFYWTSVYTVLANDFHWIFVPIYTFGLGGAFAWLERSWRQKRGTGTLIGLYLVAIFWIYSSANMQVAGSFNLFLGWGLFVYLPFVTYFARAFFMADNRAKNRGAGVIDRSMNQMDDQGN